jgi:hypothetical protein
LLAIQEKIMPIEDTSHLHITFFTDAVKNKEETLKQGRPIFEDREFVRIKFVGDPKRELVAPAHDPYRFDRNAEGYVTYAQDFPRHYQAFKDGQQEAVIGTPIEELPFLTMAKRSELKALNIHTAEQLAQLEGTPLGRLGIGGRELKNQAQAYLDLAKDSAVEMRLAAENADLRGQMSAMQEQIAELMNRMSGALPQEQADPLQPVSRFEDWPDEELKRLIREKTGQTPRGNPSHATLIRMAEEAEASEAAAA